MSGSTDVFNKDADEAVLHPTSRQLFRTWERIRGENSAPQRRKITMRDLKRILPWVCILDRAPRHLEYTWRLAGSAVCDVWGRPLTGTTAFGDWHGCDHDTMVRGLDTVVGMHQPCVGRFLARSYGGREVGFEFVALPVLTSDQDSTHVMATFAPFRDCRKIDVDPLVDFQMRSIRVLWGETAPGKPVPPLRNPISVPQRHGTEFLRVIDGGKPN